MNLPSFLLISTVLVAASGTTYAASEIQERAAVRESVQSAFEAGDYAQLEKLSLAYRTSKERTSSGLWKLTLFYTGLGVAMESRTQRVDVETAYRDLEIAFANWAKKYPSSPAPRIALSMLHIDHAWQFRGSEFASKVKPESWAPFRKYIELARRNLENHKSVAAVDPRWYETMLTIARAQNWDRADFDRLLKEAFDKEPYFYQNYFLALEYLLPKWHGGTTDIELFAQDAVTRTQEREGRGMYARIYWFASQTQYQNDLFSDSLASWQRMRVGFDDVIARYPDAWNLNNYAKFACLAGDKEKARELMKRIESDFVLEAWDPPSLRQWCLDSLRQER